MIDVGVRKAIDSKILESQFGDSKAIYLAIYHQVRCIEDVSKIQLQWALGAFQNELGVLMVICTQPVQDRICGRIWRYAQEVSMLPWLLPLRRCLLQLCSSMSTIVPTAYTETTDLSTEQGNTAACCFSTSTSHRLGFKTAK